MLRHNQTPLIWRSPSSDYNSFGESLTVSHSTIFGHAQQGRGIILLLTLINHDPATMTVQLRFENRHHTMQSLFLSYNGGESFHIIESSSTLFHIEPNGETTIIVKGTLAPSPQEPCLILSIPSFSEVSKMSTQSLHIHLPEEQPEHDGNICYLFYDHEFNRRSIFLE